jgi:hypothetical protein
MKVKTEVLGQMMLMKNVSQQSLIAWPKNQHMMGYVLIAALRAEIPDK